MTFLFRGSMLEAYFLKYGVPYIMMDVEQTGERYELCEYTGASEDIFRERLRGLVTVVDSPGLNKEEILSKNWYSKQRTKEKIQALKMHMTYFFRYIAKALASKEEIMWTCPSEYEKALSGERYTEVKRIIPQNEEHGKLLEEAKRDEAAYAEHLKCFVPCNSCGTNKYRYRRALAYCCDIHFNRYMAAFFIDGNEDRREAGLPEIILDEETFSLSCFIRWLCRSRVRDGKPVIVYMPSKRIRKIFLKWLEQDEQPLQLVS